jgi:CheY-like chemotaxis protein
MSQSGMSQPGMSPPETSPPALKVMIAEDDMMIADMLRTILTEAGYRVCGTARTVPEAVALARQQRLDLAVIDIRLADGGIGTNIAAQLSDSERPGILYATGNRIKLTAADGHACLVKPYREIDLLRGLEIIAEIIATGTALPPFPRGFQMLRPAAPAPSACR